SRNVIALGRAHEGVEKNRVDGLQGALLDVLVRPVHGVASLEADDALPTTLREYRAGLLRVSPVLQELVVLLALKHANRSAEKHVALGVERCDPRMSVFL